MFSSSGFSVRRNRTLISASSPKSRPDADSCPQALQRSNGQWCKSTHFWERDQKLWVKCIPCEMSFPNLSSVQYPSLEKLNCMLCLLRIINMFFLVQKSLCLLLSTLIFWFKPWCFLSRVCLFQLIRIYPGKRLMPCFLEVEAPMSFSMCLWNLAGKNTSRSREEHFFLYATLFSFGWDVNLLISLFSTLFLGETLAVCQNIHGI